MGCQWKTLPIEKDRYGRPEIHFYEQHFVKPFGEPVSRLRSIEQDADSTDNAPIKFGHSRHKDMVFRRTYGSQAHRRVAVRQRRRLDGHTFAGNACFAESG
jgi:hypothetical protein